MEDDTPGRDSAVSVRVTRDGWRAHVPAFLLVAIGAALNGGTCTAAGRIEAKVDDLSTRVARLEGRLDDRLARTPGPAHGAEGAGGTGALAGD